MMTSLNSNLIDNNDLIKIIKFNSDNAPLCAITTSAAGNMGKNINPEYQSRNKIKTLLGIDKIIYLRQEHTDIVLDSKDMNDSLVTGDGIITSEKITLAVTVADCLPIFIYDSKNNIYGIVHSGWKGTGIVLNAIEKMSINYGTEPKNIHVIIGPSIGSCCYSVDKERALEFASKWGDNTIIIKNSSYYIDLKKANKLMLEKAGVENINIDKNCTCCSKEFHSYRRDGLQQFSLMLALIGYFKVTDD